MFILMWPMLRVSNINCFKIYSLNELEKGVLVISFRLESTLMIIGFNGENNKEK